MTTKRDSFTIRVKTSTLEHFKALAKEQDRSVSYVVNSALDRAAQQGGSDAEERTD